MIAEKIDYDIKEITLYIPIKMTEYIKLDKKFITKPVIKWIGGKTQIIDKLVPNFPREIRNYHEVFLGGGSVLLAFLSYVKRGVIKCSGVVYAYDANEPMINLYKNIQKNPNELFDSISRFKEIYTSITSINGNQKPLTDGESIESRESYYFWIRKQYNKLSTEEKNGVNGSAMLLFLNKTCFRGMFRVGPNGFNVPFGNNKKPEIANIEHIMEVSELIQNVVFSSCPFETSFENITSGDFTYLDPPYAPNDDKSFVAYTNQGFKYQQHLDLFKICNDLQQKNVKMMMSNSHTELVTNNFSSELFTIDNIVCKRLINSSNPNDTAKEVIIRNY